jgi:hypothetical protein
MQIKKPIYHLPFDIRHFSFDGPVDWMVEWIIRRSFELFQIR